MMVIRCILMLGLMVLKTSCITHTVTLKGSGATSSMQLYRVWSTYFESYRASFKEVLIEYAARGSSFGKKEIMENKVLFAGSDIPLSSKEMLDHPDLRYFPSSAWSVCRENFQICGNFICLINFK